MKKIVALLVCLLISLPTIFSQNEEPQRKKHFDIENFKAQKMAYLIREVGITPEESAQLFPIYNEMQQKRFKLKMEARHKAKAIFNNQNATNDECLKVIDDVLDNEIEVATLEKTYYQKFKKILSPQKLLKLKRADLMFAQEVLKKADRRF
ncbi:MAG: hypothetical protein ACOYOT_04000 [Bacteroidales bacterium]